LVTLRNRRQITARVRIAPVAIGHVLTALKEVRTNSHRIIEDLEYRKPSAQQMENKVGGAGGGGEAKTAQIILR
tara:strand:- start:499 stop:720 length:222 start_codon:yes stop_codon:yes gene_type:complete